MKIKEIPILLLTGYLGSGKRRWSIIFSLISVVSSSQL